MKIKTIEPREILLEEFMKPMKITAYRLAKETKMPMTRVSDILKGRRRITIETALKFAAYFGNSADFWVGIQTECDLRKEREAIKEVLSQIRPLKIAS
jgi:addiction module HigA family antidote